MSASFFRKNSLDLVHSLFSGPGLRPRARQNLLTKFWRDSAIFWPTKKWEISHHYDTLSFARLFSENPNHLRMISGKIPRLSWKVCSQHQESPKLPAIKVFDSAVERILGNVPCKWFMNKLTRQAVAEEARSLRASRRPRMCAHVFRHPCPVGIIFLPAA